MMGLLGSLPDLHSFHHYPAQFHLPLPSCQPVGGTYCWALFSSVLALASPLVLHVAKYLWWGWSTSPAPDKIGLWLTVNWVRLHVFLKGTCVVFTPAYTSLL